MNTGFGQELNKLAKQDDVELFLEIGTWFGGGSSLCIAKGLKETNKDGNKWLYMTPHPTSSLPLSFPPFSFLSLLSIHITDSFLSTQRILSSFPFLPFLSSPHPLSLSILWKFLKIVGSMPGNVLLTIPCVPSSVEVSQPRTTSLPNRFPKKKRLNITSCIMNVI
eukprot:TRINITY_DN389_c0_g1_i1.p1 TRINITY_DN389_c0_g1~~TRINITY_DN389_c0_g1_i1.p1  ORF type:complete len:165 (+),score=7.96 TRINITY_DN389_c0_g1_i1:307-801(+)